VVGCRPTEYELELKLQDILNRRLSLGKKTKGQHRVQGGNLRTCSTGFVMSLRHFLDREPMESPTVKSISFPNIEKEALTWIGIVLKGTGNR
jgi:hypothetical protein